MNQYYQQIAFYFSFFNAFIKALLHLEEQNIVKYSP